jgi:hypothetical protein
MSAKTHFSEITTTFMGTRLHCSCGDRLYISKRTSPDIANDLIRSWLREHETGTPIERSLEETGGCKPKTAGRGLRASA